MTENTINNDMTMGGAAATLLAGRYRVVRQLGQGGMGSVWLAEDTKLDGFKVAIKMLPSVLVNNKRAYAQVKAEALVSLKLSHPNIVTVRAFEEEGGNPFLVMDYIDGQTLDDYLAEKGKLSEEETVKVLKPVAAALDYAHAQGVIHRDVKPGNVMIRKDGTPFVLDFGIAREIQETMTRVTGKLSSGTLLYMSPEQLNGETPKPAQDIYSFAAMAYECLKGEPPFSRGCIEDQIKYKTPESLGPQFVNFGQGVMAGLAKSPECRPESCAAVLERGTRSAASTAPTNRTRIAVIGALLVLAALVGIGGWLWWKNVKCEGMTVGCARQVDAARHETAWQKVEAKGTSKEQPFRELERIHHNLEVSRRETERQNPDAERIAVMESGDERTAKVETEKNVIAAFEVKDYTNGWRLAANIRNASPLIQFYVGICYANGRGGAPYDIEKALQLWQSAAEHGNAGAQYELGACYLHGNGVGVNPTEGMRWVRLAADHGYADAQTDVGLWYFWGENGIARDYAQAVKWWQLAAEQGNVEAQKMLGGCYCFGKGVASDRAKAMKWWRLAADQGCDEAKEALKKLVDGVDPNHMQIDQVPESVQDLVNMDATGDDGYGQIEEENKFVCFHTQCVDVDFTPVYFGGNSANIPPGELGKIDAVIQHLERNANRVVVLTGNCDERSSTEYALSIGEMYASVVRRHLIENGISADRIQTHSYGAERPACLGDDEVARAMNRRVEFALFSK